MEFNKIKKASIVCLEKIRNKCDQFTRSLSEHLVAFKHNQQRRLSTCSSINPQFLLKKNDVDKKSFTNSNKKNINVVASQIQIPKKLIQTFNRRKLRTDKQFENIHISKKNEHSFFKTIQKFKKCHRPANASKGQHCRFGEFSNLSNSQTNIFKYSSIQKQKQNKAELKRLSILSQVILENNRSQMRRRRQRSYDHKT